MQVSLLDVATSRSRTVSDPAGIQYSPFMFSCTATHLGVMFVMKTNKFGGIELTRLTLLA